MEYRFMGKTGLRLSALSLGSWVTFGQQIDLKAADDCMSTAYNAGINFFDNAEGYARGTAETLMGDVLRQHDWPRDSLVLSSKVYFGAENRGINQTGLSRKHIIEACHGALKRLRTDYLDLYFCHRDDSTYPIDEIVWTMNDLLQQGKILYWGTSKWPATRLKEAIDFARDHHLRGPVVEQPEYNLFYRDAIEAHYTPFYDNPGLGTTIWSPLASGLLTGKYNNGIPADSRMARAEMSWKLPDFSGPIFEAKLEKVKKLQSLANEMSTTVACLSLAWCLSNPNVTSVITGASKVSQITDNLKALEILPLLTPEMKVKIDAFMA
jgi:voltage-dependent potassium channel beta subunit